MKREPADSAAIAAIFASWSNEEDLRGEQQERLKQLFANAKDAGYNTKALRAAFKEHYRLQNQTNEQADKRAKTEGDVELYLVALARVPAHVREDDPSTAARKDVPPSYEAGLVSLDGAVEAEMGEAQPAGTQAPPVDTPSQLEETQRQGESEQRRDNGSQNSSAISNGEEGIAEGLGEAGAGTAGETPATGAKSQAKASIGNAATAREWKSPSDSGSGEASRLSDGSGTVAATGGVMAEPAPVAPIPEPEVHTSWLKSTIVPIRKPVTEAPKQDRTKPHPDCLDPAECGLSSWDWFCSSCKKAAEAKRAGAA